MKSKTQLRIKYRSLGAEARMILKEAKRWRPEHPMHQDLMTHATELTASAEQAWFAYWFLKGRSYDQLASKYWPRLEPAWLALEKGITYNVQNFSGVSADQRTVMQTLTQWLDNAKVYSSLKACIARRQARDELCLQRREAYRARYWRPEPTDQAKLKAELKAKWESAHA